MPKNKKRTSVKNLKTAKELTSDQAKRVKGGLLNTPHTGGVNAALADGSVRMVSPGVTKK